MVRDYNIEPRHEHYGCMVDLYGRSKLMKEAVKLIETIPFRPTVVFWVGVLIGGLVGYTVKSSLLGDNRKGSANARTYIHVLIWEKDTLKEKKTELTLQIWAPIKSKHSISLSHACLVLFQLCFLNSVMGGMLL